MIMAGEHKLVYLLMFLIWTRGVIGIEPFSSIGMGIATGSVIWNYMACRFMECCDSSWIPHNFTMLDISLREHLFGQHIAHNVVLHSLQAHFREDAKPRKALALSFHGLSGTGKTYVSQFITNSLYKLGPKSKNVHFFTGRNNFPVESKADIYKMNLIDWIRGNVSNCDRSLFIFDEVDKMPKKILDAITPFLDYHEEINGVDFRKAVFIFLSNTGGSLIVENVLNMWENGKKREDITLEDFEQLLRKGAFNEIGGFQSSETIQSNLIDHYVPFLPLERSHVQQCIEAEFHNRGQKFPQEEHIREVLKHLTFGPEPHKLFSNSGCKRISPKAGAVIEQILQGK